MEERIVEGMLVGNDGEKRVAIVDVGGGMGHDLVELKKKCPGLRGRFILQDLEQVIEQIPLPLEEEGIEACVHDFYTEQPVKGNQNLPPSSPQNKLLTRKTHSHEMNPQAHASTTSTPSCTTGPTPTAIVFSQL